MKHQKSKTITSTFTTLIKKIVFLNKSFDEHKNVFHGRRCVRCNECLPKFKTYHDFLKHYDAGKNLIEEKLLNIVNTGHVRKYEINFQNHLSD